MVGVGRRVASPHFNTLATLQLDRIWSIKFCDIIRVVLQSFSCTSMSKSYSMDLGEEMSLRWAYTLQFPPQCLHCISLAYVDGSSVVSRIASFLFIGIQA
jgi:hypothetical protein